MYGTDKWELNTNGWQALGEKNVVIGFGGEKKERTSAKNLASGCSECDACYRTEETKEGGKMGSEERVTCNHSPKK